MQQSHGFLCIFTTCSVEIREKWLGGRRVQEGRADRFPVKSTIEIEYASDTTCITLKRVPFALGKWSAKRILLRRNVRKKQKTRVSE